MRRELERLADCGERPRLLLHACCAPCSTRGLQLLSAAFRLTLLYFNPNIAPRDEYDLRLSELRRLLTVSPFGAGVELIAPEYDRDAFDRVAHGMESEREGGERCRRCFELRLNYTAETAKSLGYEYFATTLTVGRRKSAQAVNDAGEAAERATGVRFLVSDMKKRGGEQESVRLSREWGLYRQQYCGCKPVTPVSIVHC